MTVLINIRPAVESVSGVSCDARVRAQVVLERPGAHWHGTYTRRIRPISGGRGTVCSRASGSALPLLNDRRAVAASPSHLDLFDPVDAHAHPQVVGRATPPVSPDCGGEIAIHGLFPNHHPRAEPVRRAIERVQMFLPEDCLAHTPRSGGKIGP